MPTTNATPGTAPRLSIQRQFPPTPSSSTPMWNRIPTSVMAKHASLISGRAGQSVGMSDNDRNDTGEVANPNRTRIDDDDELSQGQTPQKPRHDPHDQPWTKVAEEVKTAVEDADGPLD